MGRLRDVRALVIFREPSKAPAGMHAEACAEAERLDDPAFAPYAAAVLNNVDLETLGDLALHVRGVHEYRKRAQAATTWRELSAAFRTLSAIEFTTVEAAGELVLLHSAIEDAILAAIKATDTPVSMLTAATERCNEHDRIAHARALLGV